MVSSTMSAGSMDAPKSASSEKPYPWIISPFIDFFFICGGGALIFFAVNYLYLGWTIPTSLTDPASFWLVTIGFLSQHLFADSHNSATYLRIWGSAEDQARFKFHRTWLAYSTIPMFILGLSVKGLTGTFVYIYLITVYWHYVAQTFGIALIYCYKRGYYMTAIEKEIFRWFMFSMVGWTTIRFLTFRDLSPRNWYGVDIPFWGPLPEVFHNTSRFLFFFMAVAFVIVLVRKYLREDKIMPWQAFLLIFTVGCLGLSKDVANTMFWLYVPGFFHGSQYLAVCLAYYLKERGMPEGMNTWEISKFAMGAPGMKYLGLVILSGVFFYVGIPHFFMQIGYNFSMIGGLVLACVNYHHFITDAAIWRLRDPYCRKILLA